MNLYGWGWAWEPKDERRGWHCNWSSAVATQWTSPCGNWKLRRWRDRDHITFRGEWHLYATLRGDEHGKQILTGKRLRHLMIDFVTMRLQGTGWFA